MASALGYGGYEIAREGQEIVRALGRRSPHGIVGALFTGQPGKYLPGPVWPLPAQLELGAVHRGRSGNLPLPM